MINEWKHTKHILPPEGILVDTISQGGMEQKLKRQGNLWFVKSGDMYVYYTPEKWRYIVGAR
ncbi:TPA: hypothetical protein N0X70_001557 [Enterobacter roggenkampii]|uniref:hypothetical protein n=1 Tax=Enterobacter roggenkampii TaxID=1812935 RepID=UPI0003857FF9|nr:hypothetical protein [Enterobacter roggenkampii]CAH5460360.1 hypothetical protein AI2941V1_0242 [Enterobacter cloacae]EPY97128.1 hypothetical protein L799_08935 [Enterobacter roggenkampii EC_38VIM1]KTK00433.1 hypothetical protein ASU70_07485 [Enterobacter roggenkampii]MCC7579602.1 hypothetical protein [Enterobacter roggenkampii]MCC7588929.1 hypothetical protein [Enterobacter roggenkampii]